MTQIGTVIDGKYEILKEVGRGGMSTVYLAADIRVNKFWAVKEINKKVVGSNKTIVVNTLLAEANMLKRMDHSALPKIVDIFDNGVTIYVVMDYVEGESLDKVLKDYGAQPEKKVINWVIQIANALSYLHSQNPPIIYRDMKPANVMLQPDGTIKIIDFGIAREQREQGMADTSVLGTKGYAPPEQYDGQADPRSDIFALGMTMHHLLTGVDPRYCLPYASVRQLNPELSESIETIINRCVQPIPENRYQGCADLIYDLEHLEQITSNFKRRQKRRLAAFFASVIMAMASLGGCIIWNQLYILHFLSMIISVYFWFRFKIPAVIGVLSGWTARKTIEQMRKSNEMRSVSDSTSPILKQPANKFVGTMPGKEEAYKDVSSVHADCDSLPYQDDNQYEPTIWECSETVHPRGKNLTLLEEVMILHTEDHI